MRFYATSTPKHEVHRASRWNECVSLLTIQLLVRPQLSACLLWVSAAGARILDLVFLSDICSTCLYRYFISILQHLFTLNRLVTYMMLLTYLRQLWCAISFDLLLLSTFVWLRWRQKPSMAESQSSVWGSNCLSASSSSSGCWPVTLKRKTDLIGE